jgi:hypothetical protein
VFAAGHEHRARVPSACGAHTGAHAPAGSRSDSWCNHSGWPRASAAAATASRRSFKAAAAVQLSPDQLGTVQHAAVGQGQPKSRWIGSQRRAAGGGSRSGQQQCGEQRGAHRSAALTLDAQRRAVGQADRRQFGWRGRAHHPFVACRRAAWLLRIPRDGADRQGKRCAQRDCEPERGRKGDTGGRIFRATRRA